MNTLYNRLIISVTAFTLFFQADSFTMQTPARNARTAAGEDVELIEPAQPQQPLTPEELEAICFRQAKVRARIRLNQTTQAKARGEPDWDWQLNISNTECGYCNHPLEQIPPFLDAENVENARLTPPLPCGHRFHSRCLYNWLSSHCCPLCGTRLSVAWLLEKDFIAEPEDLQLALRVTRHTISTASSEKFPLTEIAEGLRLLTQAIQSGESATNLRYLFECFDCLVQERHTGFALSIRLAREVSVLDFAPSHHDANAEQNETCALLNVLGDLIEDGVIPPAQLKALFDECIITLAYWKKLRRKKRQAHHFRVPANVQAEFARLVDLIFDTNVITPDQARRTRTMLKKR